MAFWMGVASAQHARGGRDGGFAQLGHGKHIAVKSLSKGDWIVYYSPREGMGEGEVVQAFTTIGRVTSDAPYRAEQAMNFNPYRVDADYLKDAEPAPIKPLLDRLRLTRDQGAHFIVSTIALSFGLVGAGALDLKVAGASLLALLPALAGMWFGQAIRQRITAATFKLCFFAGLLALGSYLVARTML